MQNSNEPRHSNSKLPNVQNRSELGNNGSPDRQYLQIVEGVALVRAIVNLKYQGDNHGKHSPVASNVGFVGKEYTHHDQCHFPEQATITLRHLRNPCTHTNIPEVDNLFPKPQLWQVSIWDGGHMLCK